MNRRKAVAGAAVAVLGSWLIPWPAKANDQDEAETAATTFVERLTDGEPSRIYADLTTAQFRGMVPQQRFEETIGLLRIQLGGVSGKPTIVGSQRLSQDATGKSGDFYFVRCRSTYNPGPLFWDIWLAKAAGRWAVNGFFYQPAQQQAAPG